MPTPTVDDVLAWTGAPAGAVPTDVVETALAAALDDVVAERPELADPDAWGDRDRLGATMYAAHLLNLRGNPSSASQFSELGGWGRPAAFPPAVARLLRVGRYARPRAR